MINAEVISFSTTAVFFSALSLLLLTGRRGQPQKALLALASVASVVWASVVAYQAAYGGLLIIAQMLELLRDLAWFTFLLAMLKAVYPSNSRTSLRFIAAFGIASAFTAGLMLLALYRIAGGSALGFIAGNDVLAGHLLMTIAGLVVVEQLYRNTQSEQRRALKYLCMGVGGMFAYDFYLYSDALLFQRVSASLWDARGFIHAMVVPVIGIALRRNLQWSPNRDSIDVFVSRRVVFHTTALLGAGIYLLAMGAGGYYVRIYGGRWGLIFQTMFLFGAVLMLAILLFSGQLRAGLRVLISKHFFGYKYDYRDEWLRFIRTLSSGEPATQLRERAVKAIAQIVESPGGILWMRHDNGRFEPVARWNMCDTVPASEPPDGLLVRFLEQKEWVINLDEHEKASEPYRNLSAPKLPDWLRTMSSAWLVVPLILHESLIGFVVLARSPLLPMRREFNWEDCDLLKTAGRQAASHLAQLEASRALAEARQFEAFNRLSAFVVHDLKNLIAQLSLVVSNAAKHKHNPQFMEDTIQTVENSVAKMNRLLTSLRKDNTGEKPADPVDLVPLLGEIVAAHGTQKPETTLECRDRGVMVAANRDRLASVVGHVIQNARDATPGDGRVTVRMRANRRYAVIEVEDTGCGMDDVFIRERLFHPFETTKGNAGMGIGAYETREFIRSIGGDIDVFSRPGHGTIFRLHVPITETRGIPIAYRTGSN
ncbi:MAG: XrtA/PEP-CTERM system histidine kinase PrsK [Acidiferrobacterales bacterium]